MMEKNGLVFDSVPGSELATAQAARLIGIEQGFALGSCRPDPADGVHPDQLPVILFRCRHNHHAYDDNDTAPAMKLRRCWRPRLLSNFQGSTTFTGYPAKPSSKSVLISGAGPRNAPMISTTAECLAGWSDYLLGTTVSPDNSKRKANSVIWLEKPSQTLDVLS